MTDRRQQAWAEFRATVDVQVRAAYLIGPGAVVSVVRTLLTQYEQVAHAELVALEARIAALEAAVAAARKDSQTSGKPPSSDVTRTGRAPRSLRTASGKRSGGQPGHPGTTLALRAVPDAMVVHAPAACAACGHGFAAADAPATPVVGERRQVFELPPVRLVVTEHQVHERRCPRCAAVSRGTFPAEVRATVQYGPGVLALGVMLTAQHLVPVQRAANIVAGLIGQRVSPATLLAAERRAEATVTPVVARIHAGLARAPVVHWDETGMFVSDGAHGGGPARGWWLHVACTPTLTHYTPHPRRGTGAHEAIGLLPTYTGTAVHDAYASYFTYAGCTHALCGAHLLRELLFFEETEDAAWARAIRRALTTMHRATVRAHAAGLAALPARTRRRYARRLTALVADGLAAEPPPPRGAARTRRLNGALLLQRLERHHDAVLRFVHDLRVPFDNSEAERDLRMMKVEQKISGGFRTTAGAQTFCTLRSYLVTARKQGVAALDAVRLALVGQPFWPAVP